MEGASLSRIRLILAAILCTAPTLRADLLSHALVRYGEAGFTTDEHFGAASATAALGYSSPGLFHGVAEGNAAYGIVASNASVLAVNASYNFQASVAEAAFSDTLTILGPPSCSPGFVIYTYSLTGHATEENSPAALFLRHGSDPDEEMSDEITDPGDLTSLAHAVVFGQPFTTRILLQSNARISLGQSGEVACEFTATMTGLAVFDADMNPLSGITITSASGTQYPIPAPSTLALLVVAALIPRRVRPSSPHALMPRA